MNGQDLRNAREAHQLTTAQLASRLGVAEQQISEYESGNRPITPAHAAQLEALWRKPSTESAGGAAAKPKKAPVSKDPAPKAPADKTPSVTQWLQAVAEDRVVAPKITSETSKPSPNNATGTNITQNITQATAQFTNDRQRRQALNLLLEKALAQVDGLFTEDKQTRALAEAVQHLRPPHAQLILSVVGQLEKTSAAAPVKAKLSANDQLLQALAGSTPHQTLINYLEAAIKLLQQAEIAEQSPLAARLQGLSEFDRSTVQMLIKRYQDPAAAREDKPEASPATVSAAQEPNGDPQS